MPALANSRHEAFARALVKGMAAGPAYVAAGYAPKGADQNASALIRNHKVGARIAELKAEAAQGAVMAAQETLERITARARSDAEGLEALQLKALELMGKHHVLFAEKTVHEFGGVAERLAAALERIGDSPGKSPKSPDRRADGDKNAREIPAGGAPRRRSARKIARKGKRTRSQ